MQRIAGVALQDYPPTQLPMPEVLGRVAIAMAQALRVGIEQRSQIVCGMGEVVVRITTITLPDFRQLL